MTRMTGPDCAVMCNSINTHTHTHTLTYTHESSSSGDGNEDGIREGGGGEKKREKPHKSSCKRHVENGGGLGEKTEKTQTRKC